MSTRLTASLIVLSLTACSSPKFVAPQRVLLPDGTLDAAAAVARREAVGIEYDALARDAEEVLRTGGYSGLTVGVVLDGALVWSSGHGQVAMNDPRTPDEHSVFRIASITKTITGLAILGLRDRGKLSLDTPVHRWLPEIKGVRPPTTDSPDITLRHLLTHTSGLPRLGGLDYATRATVEVSREELLGLLSGLSLIASPGTEVHYSNLGVALAGLVIERVVGVSFEQHISESLLRPLGMQSAAWRDEVVPRNRLVRGVVREPTGPRERHHWRMGAAGAMGGLYASLTDMARFAAFQMAAWPPRNGPDDGPIRRASVRESHRIAGFGRPPGTTYGVAWGVAALDDELMLTHTGSTWQYAACMRLLPERGLAVIALAASGPSGPLATLTRDALARIHRSLSDKGLRRGPVSRQGDLRRQRRVIE